jgi:hypothetical protein
MLAHHRIAQQWLFPSKVSLSEWPEFPPGLPLRSPPERVLPSPPGLPVNGARLSPAQESSQSWQNSPVVRFSAASSVADLEQMELKWFDDELNEEQKVCKTFGLLRTPRS